MFRFFTVLLLISILPASAFAQVYKCKDSIGKTSFSDKPCAGDSSSEAISTIRSQSSAQPESALASKEVYTKELAEIKAPDGATQACFNFVNTTEHYPDPSTTKLLSSNKKIVAVKNVGARQLLTIETTSKNPAGMYVGKQVHKCLMMGDGLTINTKPYELL